MVASELHRMGVRVISERLLQVLRGEAGVDWRFVVEAMFAEASSRAGDFLDAACRETWKSDKPERYELAVCALNACAPGNWRDMTGKERKAWLDDLPDEYSKRVLAYHAALSDEERGRLTKWMRGKVEDARGLLMFWLFDAKAEWAYRAQRARQSVGLMLDIQGLVPALVVSGAYAVRRKSGEFAVQALLSYQKQHALWRRTINEWRDQRAAWEREHPYYTAVREDLFAFLKLPGSSKALESEPPRYRKLRPGATEYYPEYAGWLATHFTDQNIASGIEVWHREWVQKWAVEPKPPTYSQIRNKTFGLQLQRGMGYRALKVADNGEASIEALLPIDEFGELAGTVEAITHFEWRGVNLRADPRLVSFEETQVGAARVCTGRQGRIYLSFKTDDSIDPESFVPLTPEVCAQYDARWVLREVTSALARPPRTVIAVAPLRESANVLLRYYENYQSGVISKWISLSGDRRLPNVECPAGRRAGYSGTIRGAEWRRYFHEKVKSTGALSSVTRPARGLPFAVKEASGYRHRLVETARRIATATIEQAHEWDVELVIFDSFPMRSTEDVALDHYRTTVHQHLFVELVAAAAKIGMRVAGIKVAARIQTCSRCGGRTVRTAYRREQGEVPEIFGERVRCLTCGNARTAEHAVADNILAALNNHFRPVKPVHGRIFECAGINVDFADREQVIERLKVLCA